MLNTTLPKLRCPSCEGELALLAGGPETDFEVYEIQSGSLGCRRCKACFPILGGVAILVDDVAGYLASHVKGISRLISDADIPPEFRSEYQDAKAELAPEHIEEDLEAERVIALYFMNHYLSTRDAKDPAAQWWKPTSPLIEDLILRHWDKGPLAKITEWVKDLATEAPLGPVIELGCGVGGLGKMLAPYTGFYLGVDSSFGSVALGRHLVLGTPYPRPIRIPADLLDGPVSKEIRVDPELRLDGSADFVVGDIEALPTARGEFDLCLALNAIDMLDSPESLPELQRELLRPGGRAIQSCPYIWHESIAAHLREILPADIVTSATAAEWLYRQSGFEIEKSIEHLPWLFFKHLRQLEIYSVHLLCGKR